MQFCFADLEQQKINSPSKQGDGRTFQEKIVNVNYVIDPKLEMNTIIFLNVIILTKNVSSHCQTISCIDIVLLSFHFIIPKFCKYSPKSWLRITQSYGHMTKNTCLYSLNDQHSNIINVALIYTNCYLVNKCISVQESMTSQV
jgi:hypothetical protein